MKIISWNVNGIRAAYSKGELKNILDREQPDILLIQEIKAQDEKIPGILADFPAYAKYHHPAEKPGYAGTAVWVRTETIPEYTATKGLPSRLDHEGRVSRIDIGDITLFGVYFPNGGKSPEAFVDKLRFYEEFLQHMNDLRAEGQRVYWTGDINVAHTPIDLARPKENEGNIGFTLEERAWVTRCNGMDWHDVWRHNNPDVADQFSWWTYRAGARDRNVGWRIDAVFTDAGLLDTVTNTTYQKDQLGSDHCPLIFEIAE